MSKIEKVSCIMTDYLVKKKSIEPNQYEIYKYGLHIGLEVIINIIISISIAVYLNKLPEAIIFLILFIPLRAYAGGFHLNNYTVCLIASFISLRLLLYLSSYINIGLEWSLLLCINSVVIIKLFSPVVDDTRPVNEIELKFFSKKLNYTLIFILVLAIVFYSFGDGSILKIIMLTLLFMIGVLCIAKVKRKSISRPK